MRLLEVLDLQWKQVNCSFDKVIVTPAMRKAALWLTKEKCFPRSILRGKSSSSGGDYRCLTGRLGRSPSGLARQWPLVATPPLAAYQSPGTQGNSSSIASFSSSTPGTSGPGPCVQHHCNALYKQRRGYTISPPLTGSPENLELGYPLSAWLPSSKSLLD